MPELNSLKMLKKLPGDVCYYYKDLITNEVISYNSELPIVAASVIKLPIMAAFYADAELGKISPNTAARLNDAQKYPGCGVISYLRGGLELTLEDICVLMIIVSDNSAANYLIDVLGLDRIEQWMHDNGFSSCHINRRLFDYEASAKGIQNYITASDIGRMLEMIYRGELVSQAVSARMLDILKDQQLNGKLPFFLDSLPNAPEIAHKTGEDDGITHDCAIILHPENPFILCISGQNTDVPRLERIMQDAALELWNLRP